MPVDRIIGTYSNWRMIERSFKTKPNIELFIINGSRKKISREETPPHILKGLLESAERLLKRRTKIQ